MSWVHGSLDSCWLSVMTIDKMAVYWEAGNDVLED